MPKLRSRETSSTAPLSEQAESTRRRDRVSAALFHLSVVQYRGQLWNEYLRFRECLRQSAAVASAYEALKSELADQFANDRPEYAMRKERFIRGILEHGGYDQQRCPETSRVAGRSKEFGD